MKRNEMNGLGGKKMTIKKDKQKEVLEMSTLTGEVSPVKDDVKDVLLDLNPVLKAEDNMICSDVPCNE